MDHISSSIDKGGRVGNKRSAKGTSHSKKSKRVRLSDAAHEIIGADPLEDFAGDDEHLHESNETDQLQDESEPTDDYAVTDDSVSRASQSRYRMSSHMAESSGAIEKVELVNFMCHANLSVQLGPNLNFIIGHNGSGKSAVLIAVSVALGGKANSTQRASSLKELVKAGAPNALVTVTLSNQGDDAYKPDSYGSKIIIERKINVDGAGSWKIKNEAGKTVATTKAELDSICDFFSIHTDNPLNVLTQDAARKFLTASNPGDLYTFYLEGTQLGQLKREYDFTRENVGRMAAVLRAKAMNVAHLHERMNEAKETYQLAQASRDFSSKIDALNKQFIWAQVDEKTREVDQAQARVDTNEQKVASAKRRSDRAQHCIDHLNAQITTAEDDMKRFDQDTEPLADKLKSIHKAIKEKNNELSKVVSQEHSYAVDRQRIRDNITTYKDQIHAENARLASNGKSRRLQKEGEREQLQARRSQLLDQDRDMNDQLQDAESALLDVGRRVQDAERARDAHRNRFEEYDTRLRQYQSHTSNSITAYGGPNMSKLMGSIDSDRGWNRKPIGPLGRYLRLRDQRWAPLMETVLGNALDGFFVTNHADRKRLERHMQNAQVSSMIFTGNDELFDFSEGEPPSHVLTVLRALEFDDEVVKRQLIISHNIERAALVERRPEGDALMRQRIQNVQQAYSADLFTIRGGATGSSSTAMARHNGQPRFTRDLTQEIEATREQKRQAEQEVQQSNSLIRKLDQERQQKERQISEIRQNMREIRRELQECSSEIQRLSDELKEDEPVKIAALEDARREAEADADRLLEVFEEVQARKEAIDKEMTTLKAEQAKLQKQADARGERRQELVKQVMEVTAERTKQIGERQHYESKRQEREDALRSDREELELLQQELDDWTKSAEEYSERVPTEGKSSAQIESEINNIKELRSKADKQAGISVEQAAAEFRSRVDTLRQAETDMGMMEELTRMFGNTITVREETWASFRAHIAKQAKHNFAYHLQMRGYSGELQFDHVNRKLVTLVNPESSTKGTKNDKSARSLSGGERSFATICLLLSMWEAVRSPIRCLDEFDVFMDQVNRRVALEMLVRTAMFGPKSWSRVANDVLFCLIVQMTAAKGTAVPVQYIFVTPQNMPNNLADE